MPTTSGWSPGGTGPSAYLPGPVLSNTTWAYSTTTMSVAPRPKVSGLYISSAFVGGTTNRPGVVARAT